MLIRTPHRNGASPLPVDRQPSATATPSLRMTVGSRHQSHSTAPNAGPLPLWIQVGSVESLAGMSPNKR